MRDRSEFARVDLGSVDLDDSPVLGISLAVVVDEDADGRREDVMTHNAAFQGGP